MEELSIHLPAMYGDHHVTEVRRLLLALPGVMEVYASSAFQTAIVRFDPEKLEKQAILDCLDQGGYLQELLIPAESGMPVYGRDDTTEAFFRHTAAYSQTRTVVSFAQEVNSNSTGRPLWPCPGMGVLSNRKVNNDD